MKKLKIEFFDGPWDGGEITFETPKDVTLPKFVWAKLHSRIPTGEDYEVLCPDLRLLNASACEGYDSRYQKKAISGNRVPYLWNPK